VVTTLLQRCALAPPTEIAIGSKSPQNVPIVPNGPTLPPPCQNCPFSYGDFDPV